MKNRIRELRTEQNLTLKGLAELVGAHFTTIGKLEREEMSLSSEWMHRIAKALGVSLAEVAGWEEAPAANSLPVWLPSRDSGWDDATLAEHVAWPEAKDGNVIVPDYVVAFMRDRLDGRRRSFVVNYTDRVLEEGGSYLFRTNGAFYAGVFHELPRRLEALPDALGQASYFFEQNYEIEVLGRLSMEIVYHIPWPGPEQN